MKKYVWMSNNSVWEVTEIESDRLFPSHRRGYLKNLKTNVRYIWNVVDGRVSFIKEIDLITNIPKYVEMEILNGRSKTSRT